MTRACGTYRERRRLYEKLYCTTIAISLCWAAHANAADIVGGFYSSPSRRVSSCSFLVSFSNKGVDLDSDAKSVLKTAIEVAITQQAPSITLASYNSREESRAAGVLRAHLVETYILAQSNAAKMVTNIELPTSDAIRGLDPVVFVNVCPRVNLANLTQVEHQIGAKSIELDVDGNLLSVPLKYVDPSIWTNVPYEPIRVRNSYTLQLEWFSSGVRADSLSCIRTFTRVCEKHQIWVTLVYGQAKIGSGYLSGSDLFSNAEALLLPKTQLLVANNNDGNELNFVALPIEADRISGWCWKPSSEQTSGAETELRLIADGRECYVLGLHGNNNLELNIKFNSQYLPEVRTIARTVSNLVESFVEANHNK